ncbi:unnamed protein product, partial [Tetraodon nigroviridis]
MGFHAFKDLLDKFKPREEIPTFSPVWKTCSSTRLQREKRRFPSTNSSQLVSRRSAGSHGAGPKSVKNTEDGLTLDRDLFKKCVQSNIVLLTQAFRKKFVIPDFQAFTSHIDDLYQSSRALSGGQVADYIPQLAKFSPELWAVSLCTVDGQRHTIGDSKVPFCLQSCVKPLKYAIAVNDHGTEYVHSFIGKEPSGLRFNKLFLNEEGEPP